VCAGEGCERNGGGLVTVLCFSLASVACVCRCVGAVRSSRGRELANGIDEATLERRNGVGRVLDVSSSTIGA